jgi:iron complex outermembrane receptor protein
METIGSIEIIKGPNSTSFGSGLGGVNLFAREIPMDEFQTKSTTTYGSFGLLKQSFFGNYGEASTKGSVNYNHLQSDGFRSSYDRKSLTLQGQQKINAKGELSFIGIYTSSKPTFLALLTRTILIIILKKPHAIGLRLRL